MGTVTVKTPAHIERHDPVFSLSSVTVAGIHEKNGPHRSLRAGMFTVTRTGLILALAILGLRAWVVVCYNLAGNNHIIIHKEKPQ